MTVDDIDLLGNGDLFFTFRKEKGKYNRVIPGTEWRWPAHSCPDLLLAVSSLSSDAYVKQLEQSKFDTSTR